MSRYFPTFKVFLFVFLFSLSLFSCKTSSNLQNEDNKKTIYKKGNSSFGNKIVDEAENYLGTPYQSAGNTKSGIDCSGLICQVYSKFDIKLPRKSSEQAEFVKTISIFDVIAGDLLFFSQNQSTISHVGIVKHVINEEIFFIHSSTSKGVIVSSLNEKYWKQRFVKAGRVPTK